jgi:hypothetical protein
VVFFRFVWSHVANGRNQLKHMFRMETLEPIADQL